MNKVSNKQAHAYNVIKEIARNAEKSIQSGNPQSWPETIVYKRINENKSYRQIGDEVGCSRTTVMNEMNKYYSLHPELKPKPKMKPVKKILKGHRRDKDNKISTVVAEITVNGYSANFTERMINENGPYAYLSYRDSGGAVITKYIGKTSVETIIIESIIPGKEVFLKYSNEKGIFHKKIKI